MNVPECGPRERHLNNGGKKLWANVIDKSSALIKFTYLSLYHVKSYITHKRLCPSKSLEVINDSAQLSHIYLISHK